MSNSMIIQALDFTDHIRYISDLHIDHVKNDNLNLITVREENLIKYLIKNNSNTFIFAGDLYDDYELTLAFIMKLEGLHINSYFVLGNHDYWSIRAPKSYQEVIKYIETMTKKNQFAHFLHTGVSYKLGKLTIIGDSSFTNFGYDHQFTTEVTDGFSWYYKPNFFADTSDFTNVLPEITQNLVKNWNTTDIAELHNKWVNFAKDKIHENNPLLIVTHWPMRVTRDFPQAPQDSWWNVETDRRILKGDFWQIFGHTHKDAKYINNNNIARQVGYKEQSDFSEIDSTWFGELDKYFLTTELQTSPELLVKKSLTLSPAPASERTKVMRRGYARAGNDVNKTILINYLDKKEEFLLDIKNKLHPSTVYAGYSNPDAIKVNENIDLASAAVDILEQGYSNNPFEFITALIITGYIYSGMMFKLDSMRKVDIYDIARYTFILQTLLHFKDELDLSKTIKIRKSTRKNSQFHIAGVEIKIPNINGKELSQNELEGVADRLKLSFSLGKNFVIENRT
ncbi:hypothetical protein WOSG25_110530 [Weissella oryzae SG25]|uniref:Calcineurin-like phosphoesterase domain-containing protein n=2 Tax=Weissella TaxID=46255 RepID=A0A069CUU0_WEIOS|nr:hypothetical protein WOSG25_110530 [Weissella oryzae SG25]